MSKRKPIVLLLAILLAFGLFSASGFFQNAKAANYGESEPSVSVAAGGSITVSPYGMSYGSRNPDTYIPWDEGADHYVRLEVNTNVTNWNVKCSKSQDLKSGSYQIDSTKFKYTSVYVSGAPSNADVYSGKEFGSVGTPSDVTDTPSTPAGANALKVDVLYDLTIIPTQEAASDYQATHTYTLTII